MSASICRLVLDEACLPARTIIELATACHCQVFVEVLSVVHNHWLELNRNGTWASTL